MNTQRRTLYFNEKSFNGITDHEIEQKLQLFLNSLDHLSKFKIFEFMVWNSFFDAEVCSFKFCDILYNAKFPMLPISRDLLQNFRRKVDRWNFLHVVEDRCWPPEWETLIADTDIAYGHLAAASWLSAKPKKISACLALKQAVAQSSITIAGYKVDNITEENELRLLKNRLPQVEEIDNYKDLFSIAGLVYENLYFLEDINSSLKFDQARLYLFDHLSALNDFFREAWKSEQPQEIAKKFKGKTGIDLSLESPNTHKNKSAMRQRKKTLNKVELSFEWHTKFEDTWGRLHFFPFPQDDRLSQYKEKILIGFIVEHLAT